MFYLGPTHKEQLRNKEGFRLFVEERLIELRDITLFVGDLVFKFYTVLKRISFLFLFSTVCVFFLLFLMAMFY